MNTDTAATDAAGTVNEPSVNTAAPAGKISVGDTPVNADPNAPGFAVKYGDYSVLVSDLPPASLAYLLQNGFSQSMADAAALTKAQKMIPTGEKDAAGADVLRDMTDDEVAEKSKTLRDARFAKILSGTVAVRTGTAGPKPMGIEAVMHGIATERMKGKLAKFKLALPTGKDAAGNPKTIVVGGKPLTRADLIAAELAKYGTEIRTEAERRAATVEQEVELSESLDDILG